MRLHHSLLVAITILVLVLSLVFPVPVQADGEPPVEPVPTGLTPTDFPLPVDPVLLVEAAAPETDPAPVADGLQPTNFPLPVDPASAQAETSADSAVDSASTGLVPTDFPVSPENSSTETQPASVPEILASIPPETSLALVDASGDLQALGSAAGADILVNGDPAWCPGTSLPGSAGCVGPYASFSELIANLGSASGAGTIYVAYNYSSTAEGAYTGGVVENIVFDQSVSSLQNLTDLTIQGGWDFTGQQVVGLSTIDSLGLRINNSNTTGWTGSITLRNLLVQNAPGRGFDVTATGNVVLDNIVSEHNNNSVTNPGTRAGIFVETEGNIVATNIQSNQTQAQTALGFYGGGAKLVAGNSISVFSSSFMGNTGYGLYLVPGQITQSGTVAYLDGIDAEENAYQGIRVGLDNSLNTDNWVYLANSLSFHNRGSGVEINTFGNTTLQAITSDQNGWGDGTFGQDGLSIEIYDNPSAQAVVLNSTFQGNQGNGLTINTVGDVTLTGVNALSNQRSGATVYFDSGEVNVSGGKYNGNTAAGLQIKQQANGGGISASLGSITLSDVRAMGNLGGDGANLNIANGSIAINGGNFSNNQGDGFYARAYGNGRAGGFPGTGSVTVQNVIASGNRYDGGFIVVDAQQTGTPGVVSAPVTVTNSTFDANSNWGIDIEAGGSITLNNVLARGNAYAGAWLGSGYDGLGGSITVQNSAMTGNTNSGIDADPWGGVVSDPARDGAIFLNTVVLTGNGRNCYDLLSGRSVETNVLCSVLAATGSGGESDQDKPQPKRPVRPAGGSAQSAELPVNSQLVESGAAVLLDCDQFSATFLKLQSSAGALLACPVQEKGQLNSIPQEKLPGGVPAASTFVQAMSIDLLFAGAPIPAMAIGGQITVQFPLPAGGEGKKLAILFWDPSLKSGAGDWAELPVRSLKSDGLDQTFPLRTPPDGLLVLAGVYQENGLVKVTTNFPGLFILVTK